MAKSSHPIRVHIQGDSGPFSDFGRSIGYRVSVGPAEYLVDCGAPIFDYLKAGGLERIRGIIGTHSHEDHRRWFTDIALYMRYASGIGRRLRLITAENIHEEFLKNSRGALERSLSADSRRVLEIPYDEFVEAKLLGPLGKYVIAMVQRGDGAFTWRVVDRNGDVVDPRKAKVSINHHSKANRPRMLYRDENTGEWIEPESYFSFADKQFYSREENEIVDRDAGLVLRAIKAHSWHGPPTIGVEFHTSTDCVIFSSDTVYDPEMWEELSEVRLLQELPVDARTFEESHIIYGNINNMIERIWSRKRFEDALAIYERGVLIHDVAGRGSIVHTDYGKIAARGKEGLILTHSPDRFVSEIPLAIAGKVFHVHKGRLREEVGQRRWKLEADIYARGEGDEAYVGFASPRGKYRVMEDEHGYFSLHPGRGKVNGRLVRRVDLYLDRAGRYYASGLRAGENLVPRPDGQVELRKTTKTGSRGKVLMDLRAKLQKGTKR